MKPIFDEVKTGSRFEFTQSLAGVAEYWDHGLLGVTAVAVIKDARREQLHRFPMQAVLTSQTEITFVCGGSVTESWVVGEQAVMDILFSNGEDTGRVLTPTIVIDIKEGLTRPTTGVAGQGEFSSDFGDSFDKGASGS
ncbi:MAG: hypothetical protein K0U66_04240 [Gammaproteobacteria bacterium]|nr:hypothetical protein [Gammaproteobacteria bacterium]